MRNMVNSNCLELSCECKASVAGTTNVGGFRRTETITPYGLSAKNLREANLARSKCRWGTADAIESASQVIEWVTNQGEETVGIHPTEVTSVGGIHEVSRRFLDPERVAVRTSTKCKKGLGLSPFACLACIEAYDSRLAAEVMF